MSFSAADVKELRESTGAGMMDCKKALTECNGDKEKAIDFLRTKGLAAVAKKQSRVAAEGTISVKTSQNAAVALEVNCETDFVAKNEDFIRFANDSADFLLANENLNTVEELLNSKTGNQTFSERLNELTLKIGEKIDVRRFKRMNLKSEHGHYGHYIHGGRIGVLVEMKTDNAVNGKSEIEELGKDLCMHIAASDTRFINESDIDENFKAREAEIYAAQLKEQGKPENMIENIVKGKLAKLASEVCLYQQKFIKNPDETVSQLIANVEKKTGLKIQVSEFSKMVLGEGIEKKQENFAEEIAKIQTGSH